ANLILSRLQARCPRLRARSGKRHRSHCSHVNETLCCCPHGSIHGRTVESDPEGTMRLKAFFPTRDIGTDPAKIRDWTQAAEDLGYAYIEVPDHVFGATARNGWTPRYNEKEH